jgi:hypothetical protein
MRKAIDQNSRLEILERFTLSIAKLDKSEDLAMLGKLMQTFLS